MNPNTIELLILLVMCIILYVISLYCYFNIQWGKKKKFKDLILIPIGVICGLIALFFGFISLVGLPITIIRDISLLL